MDVEWCRKISLSLGGSPLKLEAARKEKLNRGGREDRLAEAIEFSGLDIYPHQVERAAGFLALVSFIVLTLFYIIAIYNPPAIDRNGDGFYDYDLNGDGINDVIQDIEVDYLYETDPVTGEDKVAGVYGYYTLGPTVSPVKAMAIVVLPLLLIPMLVYNYVINIPMREMEKTKSRLLGQVPETAGYLLMSLSLVPSMERAVEFASKHSPRPAASHIGESLWRLHTGADPSIKISFDRTIEKWSLLHPDLKIALQTLLSASESTDNVERGIFLQKAFDSVLNCSRDAVEKYANSLSGPTMGLFAMGVILPIVMSSLIPLLNLGTSPEIYVFLIMNVTFPLSAYYYSERLLQRRPDTSDSITLRDVNVAGRHVIAALLISTVTFGAYYASGMYIYPDILRWWYIAAIWAVTLFISSMYYLSTRETYNLRIEERKRSKQLPDALYKMGSLMSDGIPFEKALDNTGSALDGSGISRVLKRLYFSLLTRGDYSDTISDFDEGRRTKAGLLMAYEASEKDPYTAGRTVQRIASYFRSIDEMEKEMRVKMGQMISLMSSTAVFFAPMVLGMSVSLYSLMANKFMGVMFSSASASQMIPSEIYGLIVGIFMIEMVLVLSHFVSVLEHGEDRVIERFSVARNLPMAILVFTASSILTSSFLL